MDRETYAALIETERRRFLAGCWEHGEAPTDEAWREHLRHVGRVHIHAARKLGLRKPPFKPSVKGTRPLFRNRPPPGAARHKAHRQVVLNSHC